MSLTNKHLRNALCTEWPDYLVKNKNLIMRDEQNHLFLRAEKDLK